MVPLADSPASHSVFRDLESFSYWPHAHVLLKLKFCSVFPFLQTVLSVSCSTVQSPKSAPVILHGHPVGQGPDAGVSHSSSQDRSLLCM